MIQAQDHGVTLSASMLLILLFVIVMGAATLWALRRAGAPQYALILGVAIIALAALVLLF